jgi:hypothetical protein
LGKVCLALFGKLKIAVLFVAKKVAGINYCDLLYSHSEAISENLTARTIFHREPFTGKMTLPTCTRCTKLQTGRDE